VTGVQTCALPIYYKTLQKVIEGVLVYTENVIVVNDGSTDSTSEILANFPQIQQIQIAKNKGKGNALRVGFKHAESLGYHFAITIDSDGQHFPEDIPSFIETRSEERRVGKESRSRGAR